MSWREFVRVVVGFLVICFASPGAHGSDHYSRRVHYEGEIVVRCPDKNKPTVQVLQEYSDVWHTGKESVDVRIKKHIYVHLQKYFSGCRIIVEDLEVTVQEAEDQMFPRKKNEQDAWMRTVVESVLPNGNVDEYEALVNNWDSSMQHTKSWFENYHDYDAIVAWYKNLGKKYGKLVNFKASIGKTFEGRNMPCVHITASKDPARKKFYMQCQIHAREWIAGAVCMYTAFRLVSEYGVKEDVTTLLNTLEIVLVPMVNPDGYAYSWTNDRLWRKNRMRRTGTICNGVKQSTCVGVDINRNFPKGFKLKCRPCAQNYGGPRAISEAETQHIIKNFRENAPIIGSLDFHSYGQLILRPYGMTNKTAEDDSLHKKIGDRMVQLIKNVHGMTYTSKHSYELYTCYGVVGDWLYSQDAARTNGGYRSASFCLELRGDDSSNYGFLLPANQILPTAQEVFPAIMYYMKEMLASPIHYDSHSMSSSDVVQLEDEVLHRH